MDLKHFLNNNFSTSIVTFFKELNIPLINNMAEKVPFEQYFDDITNKTEYFSLIREVYFAGQVDDSSFKEKTNSLNELKDIQDKYDTMVIFGVILNINHDKIPSKTVLSEITRLFNKKFPNRPVVVIFKYLDYLAFANCERIDYKRDKNKKIEKIGKVSLLKDIHIKETHSGHLRILEELKIKRDGKDSINSFESLYKYWQKVFDVSLINKKFYKDLFNWYCWALENVEFPNAPKILEDQSEIDYKDKLASHNAVNVIRLITRLMFVWFLKEKKIEGKPLIPETLFNNNQLKDILNYTDKTDSTYYKAILQNLFFATLNTEMEKDSPNIRKFVNRQSGVQGFYRYARFFQNPDNAIDLFKDIPFLNGGLFENLDKNIGQDNEERIDCFSNRKDNEDKLKVPDKLFFGDTEEIDLSNVYENKKQNKEKVVGLIHLLNSYKFTIDENTPLEEEVALDPELLGKVFENLLASYNPETKSTARKQTGSFYTPREIVDYMVDESLIAYLKNKIIDKNNVYLEFGEKQTQILELTEKSNNQLAFTEDINKSNWDSREEELEENLRKLFSYSEIENNFLENDSVEILKALDECKILDPACGSGAFPMGILHKMVYIISKIDPDNKKFREIQLNKAKKNILNEKDLEEELKNINEAFDDNNKNYPRKLFLIENCIYGVDIQPIAVQISKLRFFISLIVDQKVNYDKKNIGIRPLPNLETKFVSANTLIGIDKGEDKQLSISFENPELTKKKNDLKIIRDRHFGARTTKTKEKYRERDRELRVEIADLLKKENKSLTNDETVKLANWDPYNQNTSSEFFDMEWMFGIKDGFDIVIGNPPYLESRHQGFNDDLKSIYQKNTKNRWGKDSEYITKGSDLLVYFFELSIKIINNNGNIVFITQNAWLDTEYGLKTQKFLVKNTNVKKIIDSIYRYFPSGEGPNINTVITIFIGNVADKNNIIKFYLLKDNINKILFNKKESMLSYENDSLKVNTFKYSDKVLQKYKWGILHTSNSFILDLIKSLESKGENIDKIPSKSKYSFGQGLNLDKKFFVPKKIIDESNIDINKCFPLLYSGTPYQLESSDWYLVRKELITQENLISLENSSYKPFDIKTTRKKPPVLILPRGITNHFCSFNKISAYSLSGVDVYCTNINEFGCDDIIKKLWLFMNSSIFWILREISGRKNLGGGLLKSEAADLNVFPIYFDLDIKRVNHVFGLIKNRNALSTIDELDTYEHKLIDEIMFDYLNLNAKERENCVEYLKKCINLRFSKSST